MSKVERQDCKAGYHTLVIKYIGDKCTLKTEKLIQNIICEFFHLQTWSVIFNCVQHGCIAVTYRITSAVRSHLLEYKITATDVALLKKSHIECVVIGNEDFMMPSRSTKITPSESTKITPSESTKITLLELTKIMLSGLMNVLLILLYGPSWMPLMIYDMVSSLTMEIRYALLHFMYILLYGLLWMSLMIYNMVSRLMIESKHKVCTII